MSLTVLVAGLAPAPTPTPAPFDLAATAARLDDLHRRTHGTLEEKRASEKLNYHRIERGIADCMRERGRPYTMPPFADFYRDFTDDDLGYGTGRMTVIDSLTAGPRVYELNDLARNRLRGRVYRPEDGAVMQGCMDRFGGQGFTEVEPPGGWEAIPEMREILFAIAADPGVTAAMRDYRVCMKRRYGYVVEAREDFLMPAERAKHAADADCRRPAYVLAMMIVDRMLGPWERSHRRELDTLRRGWRQRVADAAAIRP